MTAVFAVAAALVALSSAQAPSSAYATENTAALNDATESLVSAQQSLRAASNYARNFHNTTVTENPAQAAEVRYQTPTAGMTAAQIRALNAANLREYKSKVDQVVADLQSQSAFLLEMHEPQALGHATHVDLGTLTGRCWTGAHAYGDFEYEVDGNEAIITGIEDTTVDAANNPWSYWRPCGPGQYDTSVISTDGSPSGDYFSHPAPLTGKLPIPSDVREEFIRHVLGNSSVLFAIWHRNDSNSNPSLYGVAVSHGWQHWRVPMTDDPPTTDETNSPLGTAHASLTSTAHEAHLYNTQYFSSAPGKDEQYCFFASQNTSDNPGYHCKPTPSWRKTTTQRIDLKLISQTMKVDYTPRQVEAPKLYGALAISGSTSPLSFDSVGQMISYSFVVSNVGDSDISDVQVSPAVSGQSPIACPASNLKAGESMTCTARRVTTQDDLDAGSAAETAAATGVDGNGYRVRGEGPVAAKAVQKPAAKLSGSVSASTVSQADESLTYALQAKNTGNMTLKNVYLGNASFSGKGTAPGFDGATCRVSRRDGSALPTSGSNGSIALAPGESVSCEATYTVAQDDIDSGAITSTGTITAKDGAGHSVKLGQSVETRVEAIQSPRMNVDVTTPAQSFSRHGEQVTFSLQTKNIGNVTLKGVSLRRTRFTGTGTAPNFDGLSCQIKRLYDSRLPKSQSNGSITLSPGETVSCTAAYAVTQTDLDVGSFVVAGNASATGPRGQNVRPPADAALRLQGIQKPAVAASLSAEDADFSKTGQTVDYTFRGKNTGNVTLNHVHLIRGDFSGSGPAPNIEGQLCSVIGANGVGKPFLAANGYIILAPDESAVCRASYTTTQADLDSGALKATSTVTASDPHKGAVKSKSSAQAVVKAIQLPAIQVSATASAAKVTWAGDRLTYTTMAKNTGNVTLKRVSLVNGDFSGTGASPALDWVTCLVSRAAGSELPVSQRNGSITLSPGESASCRAVYKVTQDDIDSGSIEGVNTVVAKDPQKRWVKPSAPAKTRVEALQLPNVGLTASTSSPTISWAGDKLTYHLTARNSGNVTLRHLGMTGLYFSGDGRAPDFDRVECVVTRADGSKIPRTRQNAHITLAPGQTATCSAGYRVTQADMDKGLIISVGTVVGTDPQRQTVESLVPAQTRVKALQKPALGPSLTASVKHFERPGEKIVYSLKARNTGNVTLRRLALTGTDFSGSGPAPVFTGLSCVVSRNKDSDRPVSQKNGRITLSPGESAACTAAYTSTQADVDAGAITSAGTASAKDPRRQTVQPKQPATAKVKALQKPVLTIFQTSDHDGRTATAGNDVVYTAHAANRGNITLQAVKLMVTRFSGRGQLPSFDQVSCAVKRATGSSAPLNQLDGQVTLAPSESVTCVATPYKVTAADASQRKLTSYVGALGLGPAGKPVKGQPVDPLSQLLVSGDSAIDEIKLIPLRSRHGLAYSGSDVGPVGLAAAALAGLGLLVFGLGLAVPGRLRRSALGRSVAEWSESVWG